MVSETLIQTPRYTQNRTVLAALTFIRPYPGEKPRFLSAALAGDAQQFFFDTERKLVCIEDVRAWPRAPRLDREGFALVHHPTDVENLADDRAVDDRYLDEIERLLAKTLGAEQVVVFDVTRRSDAPQGASNRDGRRRPAGRIHVDYTEASGPKRAADVLGHDHVRALLAAGQRIVQVNVWRPMVGPVQRSPLALADAQTVAPSDLVATDQVFPDRVGEIYHLSAGDGQRFGYVPEMSRDEVILIKGWDSKTDGRARFTPHSAFELPDQSSAPPRHSIEVRTFAVLPR